MYCRNCGAQMHDEAVVCIQCGVPKGSGNKFCDKCGAETHPDAVVCVRCGCSFAKPNSTAQAGTQQFTGERKSKLIAGLLGIFLGALGVHNFYLGFNQKGITQLLICLLGSIVCGLGPIVAGIWGLVEGIQILTGSKNVDANGNPLTSD